MLVNNIQIHFQNGIKSILYLCHSVLSQLIDFRHVSCFRDRVGVGPLVFFNEGNVNQVLPAHKSLEFTGLERTCKSGLLWEGATNWGCLRLERVY